MSLDKHSKSRNHEPRHLTAAIPVSPEGAVADIWLARHGNLFLNHVVAGFRLNQFIRSHFASRPNRVNISPAQRFSTHPSFTEEQ